MSVLYAVRHAQLILQSPVKDRERDNSNYIVIISKTNIVILSDNTVVIIVTI